MKRFYGIGMLGVALLSLAFSHAAADGAERPLVRMEAEVLSIGPVEKGGREPLPLKLPLLIKTGNASGVFVEKDANGEPQIVLEKQAGSEEVAMQFEWPNPPALPGRLTLSIRLMAKTVSKGGALNVIFRSSDGERVVPRLQISNGGNLALVGQSGEVHRFAEKLPEEVFSNLMVKVDYIRREVILQIDDQVLGEPVPIERGRPVTHITLSAHDESRARWTAFSSIVVTEEL